MKQKRDQKKAPVRRARPLREYEDITLREPLVSNGALRSVIGIFILAIALFLMIAEFSGGGILGASMYQFFSWLFGIGYSLLPLSLVLLSILIFRSYEQRFGLVQVSGMFVFLLASLGLTNVASTGRGGALGRVVSNPLLSTVDTTASVLFLIAFIVASLVIAFDTHLGLFIKSLITRFVEILRRPKAPVIADDTHTNVPITGLTPETPKETVKADSKPLAASTSEHHEDDDIESAAPTKKEGIISSFLSGTSKNDTEGFAIPATGSTYVPPALSILAKNKGKPEVGDVKANMNIIKRTLQNFGIQVEMDEASIGPTVTRYAMKPAEGVRLSKILALQSNLELALAASPVRIEAPIPGKSLVGIEVPNIARTTLGMSPLLSDPEYTSSVKPLLMAMGRTITGSPIYADLARMPHLLVAGTTGAGKSVTINGFIISLLYRCGPEKLRFIMVDPKRVELTLYNSIPHLLTPVITDAKKAILALKWLAKEMDRRYNILEGEKVRDISSYHENILKPALAAALKLDPAAPVDLHSKPLPEAMPYIVVVVDELADIMQTYPRELESGIVRLAQMSRAVGIHLILSTQRPSVKVITGLIKANVPGRVALQVASQIDSRTILDMGGAEKLIGAGDSLFLSGDMSKPRRIQAPYVSESEVKKVVEHLSKMAEGVLTDEIDFSDPHMGGGPDPIFSSMIGDEKDSEDDELYGEAKKTVIEAGKASTSYLQRKLGVGYARAARLMDILEDRGVIGPGDGAKPRTVIGECNADELAHMPEVTSGENDGLI